MKEELFKIDKATGELIPFVGSTQTIEQKIAWVKKQQAHKTQNEYGAFTWFLFNRTEEIFPNLKPSNITRLMFISTYLNYDGYLSYDNRKDRIINRKNMNELLKLSRTEYYRFFDEMVKEKIFNEREDKIYINAEIFTKGKIKDINSDFTRICASGVRTLYNKSNTTEHKSLSVLFRMLPYVNIKYNIVCENPKEKEIDLVEPLTLSDLSVKMNYSKTNLGVLKSNLTACKINGKSCVNFVSNNTDNRTWTMFLNPQIFFAGKDYRCVEVLGGFSPKIKKYESKPSKMPR